MDRGTYNKAMQHQQQLGGGLTASGSFPSVLGADYQPNPTPRETAQSVYERNLEGYRQRIINEAVAGRVTPAAANMAIQYSKQLGGQPGGHDSKENVLERLYRGDLTARSAEVLLSNMPGGQPTGAAGRQDTSYRRSQLDKFDAEYNRTQALVGRMTPEAAQRFKFQYTNKLDKLYEETYGSDPHMSPVEYEEHKQALAEKFKTENFAEQLADIPGNIGFVTDKQGEKIQFKGSTLQYVIRADGKIEDVILTEPVREETPEGVFYWINPNKPEFYPTGTDPQAKEAESAKKAFSTRVRKTVDAITKANRDLGVDLTAEETDAILDNVLSSERDYEARLDKTMKLLIDGRKSGDHPTTQSFKDKQETIEQAKREEAIGAMTQAVKQAEQEQATQFGEQRALQDQQKAEVVRKGAQTLADDSLRQKLSKAKDNHERWAIRIGDWTNNRYIVDKAHNPVMAQTKQDVQNAPMDTVILHNGTYLYKANVDGHPVLFKMPTTSPTQAAGPAAPA
jgi:hypothetical protein